MCSYMEAQKGEPQKKTLCDFQSSGVPLEQQIETFLLTHGILLLSPSISVSLWISPWARDTLHTSQEFQTQPFSNHLL